jgi:hypothetical protein
VPERTAYVGTHRAGEGLVQMKTLVRTIVVDVECAEDEMLTLRIEIFKILGKRKFFAFVQSLDSFHLKPSFTSPAIDADHEFYVVSPQFDGLQLAATSVDAAVSETIGLIEKQLQRRIVAS